MSERILTREFALVFAANLANGVAFALFLHLPGFLAGLGAGEAEIGLIFGLAAAASIVLRPLVGTAMDRYGRRPVILVGNVLNILFVGAYLTVSSLGPWVYAVRIGHGVAEAMLFSALFTYGADVVPASRRTEGLALFGVSGLLPIAIGGVLGDAILALGGFRELFLAATALTVVTLSLSVWLPERRPTPALGNAPRGFWATVRDRRLLPIWWMIGMFSFVLTGYFVFIRTFVDTTGVGSVALFFGAYAGTAIAVRVFLSRLPDRFGPKRVLYPALGFLAAGFVVLAAATSASMVGIAGALCGVGHGFVFPILSAMMVDRAPEGDRGSATSVFTSLLDVGTLVGGPVLGMIVAAAGYPAMYAAAAVTIAVAGVVFARWDRTVTGDPTTGRTALTPPT
ncbi:MAG TPA: MFS transporter [Actinobacteria bacterium]|nr:MFS transporter [Actinomycetota bacterium]